MKLYFVLLKINLNIEIVNKESPTNPNSPINSMISE